MADKVLILLGMKCPRPLFEVSKQIRMMEPGQVLEAQADDPAFKLDIEAWCRRTNNPLTELRKEGTHYVALIRKA